MISKDIPALIDIEKMRRVAVSHFISERVIFILKNDLDYFDSEMETVLLKLINVSLAQIRTLS